MKTIMTAINNYKLNEKLKEENKFKIIGKDIQYKEAILEILEKNKNIDIIIINEKIPGEINLLNLIKKIQLINRKIKIIIILENENIKKEKELNKLDIYDIYYNNKINLNELIKIINKKEINMKQEIEELKKIIAEKENIEKNNKIKNKNKDKINIKIIKNNLIERYKIKNYNTKIKRNYKNNNKILTVSGGKKVGKSTIAIFLSLYLIRRNKKVMLIDFSIQKPNLDSFIFIKKNIKKLKIKENYINNKKNKIEKDNNYKNKKDLIKYFKKIEIKINKNLILFPIKYLFIENKKINTEKNINNMINNLFYIYKNKFDYIIIDFDYENSDELSKIIFGYSDQNLIVYEENLLGIKLLQKILEKYKNKYNIEKNKICIIKNKAEKNNINKDLIKNILKIKSKIIKINYNKDYIKIKNKIININKIILNKNINKNIKKIVIKY